MHDSALKKCGGVGVFLCQGENKRQGECKQESEQEDKYNREGGIETDT